MTQKPELKLVQPRLAHDELEVLVALYLGATGREPTPDELEDAREMLEGTDSLLPERN